MTAVGYPDIIVISQNGKYRAEARSPDNGTVNQRDGTPSDTSTFGYTYHQEQRGFRYQLIDHHSSAVIWERWQEIKESSPHELCVSNDGWVVIRLHGHDFASLIAVSLEGRDAATVSIARSETSRHVAAQAFIADSHVSETTAGLRWTAGATRYFFGRNNRPYFCYVTGWGRRIVLDLERGRVASEPTLDSDLELACSAAEQRMVIVQLAQVAEEYEDYDGIKLFGGSADKPPYWRRWPYLAGHIGLVIRNACSDALPSLCALEPRSVQQGYTGCHALPNDHNVFKFGVRPLLNLAMRYLGQTPAGYACYGFFRSGYTNSHDGNGKRILLHVPECVHLRDEKIGSVSPGMNSQQVLEMIGAPDFMQHLSERIGQLYVWGEHWYYYIGTAGDLAELCITWRAGSNGTDMAGLELRQMNRDDVLRRIYEVIGS